MLSKCAMQVCAADQSMGFQLPGFEKGVIFSPLVSYRLLLYSGIGNGFHSLQEKGI